MPRDRLRGEHLNVEDGGVILRPTQTRRAFCSDKDPFRRCLQASDLLRVSFASVRHLLGLEHQARRRLRAASPLPALNWPGVCFHRDDLRFGGGFPQKQLAGGYVIPRLCREMLGCYVEVAHAPLQR